MKSSPIMTMQLSFCVAFAAAVVIVCVNRVTGYLPVDAYDNGHVGKKGSPRYADYGLLEVDAPPSSCTREADYEISQNYIIRTKDSKQNGANFVAALSVRTFDVCLEQCCLKENCDTTIFVGEAYRSEETNCFLFVCRPDGKYGDNRCLFTYHLGYISSMKKALGGFEGYASDPITTAIPVQQIETTTKPTPPPKQFPPIAEPDSNCPEGYFECDSGQCINELYICNSVLDCDDGTDEYGCNPQEPPPAEKTNADQDMFTEAPVPIDENAPQSVEVVTVVAPPNEAVTDGKAKDDGKVNDTNVLTQQDGPNMLEMVPESHGGSGMPPASSAILPLVIGLVITVCLLLMVGCRLRYMNQRLRYGRLKTSAHDADYLINGMYL